MDKISIIVPIYNCEKYLEKCLTSIVNQTHKNLEIILVNDGSTDNSKEIAEKFLKDERVQLYSIPNSGQSVARNFGLDIATGDYIMFSDSDDFYEHNMAESLLNHLVKYHCDIAICAIKFVYQNNTEVFFEYPEPFCCDKDKLFEMFCKENKIISSPVNKIYRKEIFSNLRYPAGMIFEDRYLSLDIFSIANSVVFTGEIGYNYIQRAGSTVNDKFNTKRLSYIEITKREVEFIKLNYPKYFNLIANNTCDAIISILYSIYRIKNFKLYSDIYKNLLVELKKENEAIKNVISVDKYKANRLFYKHKKITILSIKLRAVVAKILKKLKLKKSNILIANI